MKLHIISSTDRPNSNAAKISNFVRSCYTVLDIDAQVFSLKDYPLHDVVGGRYGHHIPSVEKFNTEVLSCDGLIFVIPEYNGGFPGILKIFIDYLPFPESFVDMPICLIGEANGGFGAVRAIEQFQLVAGYRNAYIFPHRVFIPRVGAELGTGNGPTREELAARLHKQAQGFVKFINRLKI